MSFLSLRFLVSAELLNVALHEHDKLDLAHLCVGQSLVLKQSQGKSERGQHSLRLSALLLLSSLTNIEVLRFGVVHDDGACRLLRIEHEFLGQFDADVARVEDLHELSLVL